MASWLSLVPRPSMPPVFDCLQYAKMEGEGLGNFITWSMARRSHQMSSCLLLTAKWYTRPIVHSVLATKMGQAPLSVWNILRLKAMHDSKRQQSDRPKNTQWSRNHLMERKDGTIWSCTAYITAIPQRLSFEPGYVLQVGLTSPLELVSIL